jgi:hypothetical protein
MAGSCLRLHLVSVADRTGGGSHVTDEHNLPFSATSVTRFLAIATMFAPIIIAVSMLILTAPPDAAERRGRAATETDRRRICGG